MKRRDKPKKSRQEHDDSSSDEDIVLPPPPSDPKATKERPQPTFEEGEILDGTDNEGEREIQLDDAKRVAAATFLSPDMVINTKDSWKDAKESVTSIMNQVILKIIRLEHHASTLHARTGSAQDMAADALLKSKENWDMASSAMRQSSKMCIHINGDKMPQRTSQGESNTKKIARQIMKNILKIDVEEELPLLRKQQRYCHALLRRQPTLTL